MRRYRNSNLMIKIVLIAVTVFCSVTILKLQFDYNDISDREKELIARRDEAADEVALLQEKLDEPFDDDYVIGVAHEKLNLRLPEEIVFYNDLTE